MHWGIGAGIARKAGGPAQTRRGEAKKCSIKWLWVKARSHNSQVDLPSRLFCAFIYRSTRDPSVGFDPQPHVALEPLLTFHSSLHVFRLLTVLTTLEAGPWLQVVAGCCLGIFTDSTC